MSPSLSLYVILGLVTVIVLAVVFIFNQLVGKRQMVRNGWADIDVQLKRRSDLIPQLLTSVKAYASHERQLFEDITAKRSAAQAAGDDPATRGQTESALSAPVGRLLAVAEDYPELKASDNFLSLQDDLADTENKIEMARRFYNGAVRELNIAVQRFPANMVAGAFGFQAADFFEIAISDRANPVFELGAD